MSSAEPHSSASPNLSPTTEVVIAPLDGTGHSPISPAMAKKPLLTETPSTKGRVTPQSFEADPPSFFSPRRLLFVDWLKFILLSVAITLIAIAVSLLTAYKLLVTDLNFTVPIGQGIADIDLGMELVSADPVAGTLLIDWYPRVRNCAAPPKIYDIYSDPNILSIGNPNKDDPTNTDITSNLPPTKPSFRFNTRSFCQPTLKDSLSTFRITYKLITDDQDKFKATLQAYPYDRYLAQISLFALDNGTAPNVSVGMQVAESWGVPVNFQVELDPVFTNRVEGFTFKLRVSRSMAVKLFIVFIVISNWIVTLVFLWITIACLFWKEEVVRELFVIPVSVLFAFTAVRSSMPGSPAGFGAFIDFVGILPNLGLLTLCSFILLFAILYNRIVETAQLTKSSREDIEEEQEKSTRKVSVTKKATG